MITIKPMRHHHRPHHHHHHHLSSSSIISILHDPPSSSSSSSSISLIHHQHPSYASIIIIAASFSSPSSSCTVIIHPPQAINFLIPFTTLYLFRYEKWRTTLLFFLLRPQQVHIGMGGRAKISLRFSALQQRRTHHTHPLEESGNDSIIYHAQMTNLVWKLQSKAHGNSPTTPTTPTTQ